MPFVGAINSEVRRWIGNIAPIFDNKSVVIGCSGNFTVEQILTRHSKPKHLWGNDVSLYTSVVGSWLTNQNFRLKIRDPDFHFLAPFIKTPLDQAATIVLLNEALKYEACKNFFQVRLWNHYQNNFQKYHQGTLEKLKERQAHIRMQKYTSKDIADLLNEIPKTSIVIAFLPTYAGGYEKLYKRMEEVFNWDRPAYTIIDADRKAEIIKQLTSFSYIHIDDTKIPDLPLVAQVEKNTLKSVYLYSNIDFHKKSYLRKTLNMEAVFYERLTDDHEITPQSKISIKFTNNNVINYFRNIYLKKGIDFVNGDLCLLVFIDQKLFGFLIFVMNRFQTADVYLMSDFVLSVSNYSRLSKLLLLVTKTDRIKEILEQKYVKKIGSIFTTVFTDKPASMKYRGIYTIHSKKEGRLNYTTETGTHKIKKVVKLWLREYHKKAK